MEHARHLVAVALLLGLGACGEEARLRVSAVLPPPLTVDMLTVNVRDGARLIEWSGADFAIRTGNVASPNNDSPTTLEVPIATSGPDLQVSFALHGKDTRLSASGVTLPRRRDMRWSVVIWAATANPTNGWFGFDGARAFPLAEAVRAAGRDSIWVAWGGNSIRHPVTY